MNRLPIRLVIAVTSSCIAGLSVIAFIPGTAAAQTAQPQIHYVFRRIADTTAAFTGLSCNPTVADGGIVAFVATTADGRAGIFAGAGGPITTIADTTTFLQLGNRAPPNAFEFPPTVNLAGMVAFTGILPSGVEGVFVGNGGPVTTIADTTSPLALNGFAASVINNSGRV